MKIVNQSVQDYNQEAFDLLAIKKQIEKCGKVCYKSEGLITPDSYEAFHDMILKNRHTSVFEHGTVYLKKRVKNLIEVGYYKHFDNFYCRVNSIPDRYGKELIFDVYITTNYRFMVEHDLLEDLKYLCEPTQYHEKRITYKLITNLQILSEITRHRVGSYSVESTRFCNYSKGKFNNELTFIKPCWNVDERWENTMGFIEDSYLRMIDAGAKPQEAAQVLPKALKTEIVMTCFESDWDKIIKMRSEKVCHPQMIELMNLIKEKYEARNNK